MNTPINLNNHLVSQTTTYVSELIKTFILPNVTRYVNDKYDINLSIQELETMLALQTINKTSNKRCAHVGKRAKAAGKPCEKFAVEGSDFCQTHKNTASKKIDKPSKLIDKLPKSAHRTPQFEAEDFCPEKSLVIIKMNNYILKKEDTETSPTFTLVGKFDELEDCIHRLTNEEVAQAVEEGFTVDEHYDLN